MRRILFPAPLTFDLVGYGNDSLIEEILLRSGLMMATFDEAITAYGIVDAANPRTAVPGSLRPLSVSVVGNSVRVESGIAVFRSGEIIIINEAVVDITLADYTPNSRNVVYLEFSEKESNPVLTRYNTLVNSTVTYLDSNSEYVKVLKKDDYDALSLDELDNTIPLAIVTTQIVTSSDGLSTTTRIAVDMTANTYSGNRPWFSVVDAEHRSHLGTGAVTDVNVHGLSVNDLSAAGNLTLLQVSLDHGMIVSKDRGLAGVPGYLCTETPTVATDNSSGTVTGVKNANYVKLSRIPLQVHRVFMPVKATGSISNIPTGGGTVDDTYFTISDGENPPVTFYFDSDTSVVEDNTTRAINFTASNSASQMRTIIMDAINLAPILNITASAGTSNTITLVNDKAGADGNVTIIDTSAITVSGMSGGAIFELAHFWVPGTNIVSILPTDEYTTKGMSAIEVIYSSVDAAEPIIAATNPTFNIKAQSENEVLVSGGLFLQNITGTELSFENEGSIPSKYTSYIDNTGSLQKFPQTVFCYKRLVDMGFSLQSFENSILGPCRLRVWLAHNTIELNATPFDLQIQITGQDVDENTITETVKFTAVAATGLITAVAGSVIVEDTDNFIISDGINPAVTFIFDSNSSVPENSTTKRVQFTPSDNNAANTASNIRTAINNSGLNLSAVVVNSNQVAITNTLAGIHGNQTIPENVGNAGFVVSGMSGGYGWAENVAPSCSENPYQYLDTDTTWLSVDNVIVSTNTNTSAEAAILIQGLVDPVSVESLADVLPVAEIMWNGQQVCNIQDIRPINTSLNLPDSLNISAAAPITASFYASLQGSSYKLYQYWAEDFDKPKFVSTEVEDTTFEKGLTPTVTSISKLSKGLGKNDVYVSRPIPIKPYINGSAYILKFVPVQAGAYFTLKVRHYRAGSTNAWSNWSTLSAPYEHSVAFTDVLKWQMVITGQVEGMYVILTVGSGVTVDSSFVNNLGAFIDGVP